VNCKVCGQIFEWCWCNPRVPTFRFGPLDLSDEQQAQLKDGLKKIKPLSFKQKLEGYYGG